MFSLLLLLLVTTTASPVGGDDTNGVITNKCFVKERHALLHFKSHLLQDPSDTLSSWRAENDECSQWRGVTCSNQTGHVIGLELVNRGLVGELSHSLANLSYLNHLDLSSNFFHGSIPTFIGSMTRLSFLNLSYNGFIGTIPSSVGSLTELRYLDLSGNYLYGTIPPQFGNLTNLQVLYLGDSGRCRVEKVKWLSHLSNLQYLNLDGISLAKANHWVDAISSLRNLSFLSLEGCELSQVMSPYSSSFLNSSSSSIQTLYLGYNSLTSSMYPWLFPLTSNKLRELFLSGNMLDGVPKYLGNLCGLETLVFYKNSVVVNLSEFLNNLSGCTSLALQELYASESQLTGSLSDEIQKFSSLRYLLLSHNQLNGSISEKLWEIPSLEIFEVSFNNLTLPSTYHLSSLSYVKELYLRSCKFLGPRFPKWILPLKNLIALDLSNIGISDTIPLEFWYMWPSQLHYLNLSSNNISGKVPDLLSKFAKYLEIDLSSNSFYGPISNVPSTLILLNLSINKFSGVISFICQIVDGSLFFLDLSHNSFIGQIPDCLWHFKELKVLNLGHNNLFGSLPPSIGSLTHFLATIPWKLNNVYSYDTFCDFLKNKKFNEFSARLRFMQWEPDFYYSTINSFNLTFLSPSFLHRHLEAHKLREIENRIIQIKMT